MMVLAAWWHSHWQASGTVEVMVLAVWWYSHWRASGTVPGLFCCDQHCCSQDLVHSLCCTLPGLDSGEVLKLRGQQPKVSGASAAGLQQCTSSQLTVANCSQAMHMQLCADAIAANIPGSVEICHYVQGIEGKSWTPGVCQFNSNTRVADCHCSSTWRSSRDRLLLPARWRASTEHL